MTGTIVPLSNRLLSVLSTTDFARLRNSLEKIGLEAGDSLEPPHASIPYVYFVTSGLISLIGISGPDHRIEVGMVGFEGMTGLAVVLGEDRSHHQTVVQSAGTALRLSSPALRDAMNASPTLTALLLRYVHVSFSQATYTALANGRGRVRERLARWLLMWQDRLRSRELHASHDFLAILLGVRRPAITDILHVLEGDRLIKATRRHITILDRAGLKLLASGFYGVPEADYERSIQPALIHPISSAAERFSDWNQEVPQPDVALNLGNRR